MKPIPITCQPCSLEFITGGFDPMLLTEINFCPPAVIRPFGFSGDQAIKKGKFIKRILHFLAKPI